MPLTPEQAEKARQDIIKKFRQNPQEREFSNKLRSIMGMDTLPTIEEEEAKDIKQPYKPNR